MSDTPMQDVVTGIVADFVGKYLSKKEATELVGRIVKGVLMTRQGAGLPEKPGRSTQCSANEKSGQVEPVVKGNAVVAEPVEEKKPVPLPPGYEDPKQKRPRTLAIVSMPFDNPHLPPDQQDGTAPFAIQARE